MSAPPYHRRGVLAAGRSTRELAPPNATTRSGFCASSGGSSPSREEGKVPDVRQERAQEGPLLAVSSSVCPRVRLPPFCRRSAAVLPCRMSDSLLTISAAIPPHSSGSPAAEKRMIRATANQWSVATSRTRKPPLLAARRRRPRGTDAGQETWRAGPAVRGRREISRWTHGKAGNHGARAAAAQAQDRAAALAAGGTGPANRPQRPGPGRLLRPQRRRCGPAVVQVGGFRAFGIGLAYVSLDSYREELYAGVPEQSAAGAGDAARTRWRWLTTRPGMPYA